MKCGWSRGTDVRFLAPLLRTLSDFYNAPMAAPPPAERRRLLPARLLFSFPRDVPKTAAAVTELVATGLLSLTPERPLRILDLGAGLGASLWGIVRALAASGAQGVVHATLVDNDAVALDLARTLTERAPPTGNIRISLTTRSGGVDPSEHRGDRFDLVVLANVLSELGTTASGEDRLAEHARLLATLRLDHLTSQGSLLVVEPALRDRTRHLQQVRDVLAEQGIRPFAPCLHAAPCPLLRRRTDWCHEDLPVDLPPWLIPVARAAGLRFEGLTFSYAVWRADNRSLRASLAPAPPPFRLVASPRRTKGKRELLLCGSFADHDADARWVARLDRHGSSRGTDPLVDAHRGDLLTVDPPLAPRQTMATVSNQFAPALPADGSPLGEQPGAKDPYGKS